MVAVAAAVLVAVVKVGGNAVLVNAASPIQRVSWRHAVHQADPRRGEAAMAADTVAVAVAVATHRLVRVKVSPTQCAPAWT